MGKPKVYGKRVDVWWPESLIAELESLAFVREKGNNVSEVIRYIVAEWLLRNQAEVQVAKNKLAQKKGVLNLKKVDSEKWLTNKLLNS